MGREKACRMVSGGFTHKELRNWLAAMSMLFWGLIFLAWLSYPADHHYSIMSHTFSFLGSFEPKHNPDWWWIFTLAMSVWAWGMVPVAFYVHRRFSLISRMGAGVGLLFMLAGCAGVFGVALFPDARGNVIGSWEWTEIHEKVAVLVAIGYGLGILWHGALLLFEWARARFSGRPSLFSIARLALPYLFWAGVTGAGVVNQVNWAVEYERRKAAAEAAGRSIGSSWGESLNTINAFPLWENLSIYAIFAFLVWFAVALPAGEHKGARLDA